MKANKCLALAVVSSMFLTTAMSGAPVSAQSADQMTKSIMMNDAKGVPSFLTGKLSERPVRNSGDVLTALGLHRGQFKMNSPQDELALVQETTDKLGEMYKYRQVYKGVPVYGQELIVHANNAGDMTSVNGYYDPQVKIKGVSTRAKLSAAAAITAAKKHLGLTDSTAMALEKAELFIAGSAEEKYSLVYVVTLSTLKAEAPFYQDVFVNAHDGSITRSINRIAHASATGSGTGVLQDEKTIYTESVTDGFLLRDLTKPMNATGGVIETFTAGNTETLPGTVLSDADNVWSETASGVDAHFYAGRTYDYFWTHFGRNSYDNQGSSIRSVVNFGQDYVNAFWNGTQLVFGDADGTQYLPLSGALDIVAHEYTHGVIETTAGLNYQDQSGALNESFADVFGNLVQGDSNWLLGEDVYTPGVDGDATRSMADPALYGQPAHMSQYVNTTSDNGGVHTNSGIPNKAFYNFVTSEGVTVDEAAQVWYRALTQYLVSSSQFLDARNATLQAAIDLYGEDSPEVIAVTNAWAATGIGQPYDSSTGTDTTPFVFEPNNTLTEAYGPLQSGVAYEAYISEHSDDDYYQFTAPAIGQATVMLSSLPFDYDLYIYGEDGQEIAHSSNGSTTEDVVTFAVTSGRTYYIHVKPLYYSTTDSYLLQADYPLTGDQAPSDVNVYEPNNSKAEATPLTGGSKIYSYLTSTTDHDFYKFTSPVMGQATVQLGNLPYDYELVIFDEYNQTIGSSRNGGTRDEMITFSTVQNMTYYIDVQPNSSYFSTLQPYSLLADFSTTGPTASSDPNIYEPNNTRTAAYGPLQSGTVYGAYTTSSSDQDFYKFTPGGTGTAVISLTNLPYDLDFSVLDAAGNSIGYASNGGTKDDIYTFDVIAGNTYYVQVKPNYSYSSSTYPYALKVEYPLSGGPTQAELFAYEPNDTRDKAWGMLQGGVTYQAYATSQPDEDWYKFTVQDGGQVTVTLSNLPKNFDLQLYDASGSTIGWSKNSGTTTEVFTFNGLSGAVYYIHVDPYADWSTTQPYHLRVDLPAPLTGGQWLYEAVAFDTPHPYANNYNNGTAHMVSKPGALKIGLHYTTIDTESGYDYINIKDQAGSTLTKISGAYTDHWVLIDGDTITSNFTTDGSVTKYGYTIDQIKYYLVP
ncbi:hypothetical protein CBW65_00780 [Tumebacillus avium]|uniref:Peptidase M4 family protein n=1 Tax=Tumebacillus avium TaxID=1903704 RepID=A0A1Y0IGZ1_9BACL|nr:M4 family metallopeptidase [Tumebacillus avium]ARU59741.1 hypothetical protein CBW65_00780 [Tumebacillus avium]